MEPFTTIREAVRWADYHTPEPRWVNVVVRIKGDWFHLQTTQITYPAKLATRATQVYGKQI